MAGTFWTQAGNQKKFNYIYKFLTLGHACILKGVKKCQPCVFVPCAYQQVSQWFVTTESCDLMIPHMVWPTHPSRSDGWIPSQYPQGSMFRQVRRTAKHVPMLFFFFFSPRSAVSLSHQDCFTGQSPICQGSLGAGWRAAGLGRVEVCFGEDLTYNSWPRLCRSCRC